MNKFVGLCVCTALFLAFETKPAEGCPCGCSSPTPKPAPQPTTSPSVRMQRHNLPAIPFMGVGIPAYTPYVSAYTPYPAVVPASYPVSTSYSSSSASSSSSATIPTNSPPSPAHQTFNIPPTTGIVSLPASAPLAAEAQVRLRYVELQVSGMNTDDDKNRLEQTLSKLKEVRGVSIKTKGDGSLVAKVWYSEKDPVQVDGLIEAVTNLGFAAVAN
jgi:hypothetical protein